MILLAHGTVASVMQAETCKALVHWGLTPAALGTHLPHMNKPQQDFQMMGSGVPLHQPTAGLRGQTT